MGRINFVYLKIPSEFGRVSEIGRDKIQRINTPSVLVDRQVVGLAYTIELSVHSPTHRFFLAGIRSSIPAFDLILRLAGTNLKPDPRPKTKYRAVSPTPEFWPTNTH